MTTPIPADKIPFVCYPHEVGSIDDFDLIVGASTIGRVQLRRSGQWGEKWCSWLLHGNPRNNREVFQCVRDAPNRDTAARSAVVAWAGLDEFGADMATTSAYTAWCVAQGVEESDEALEGFHVHLDLLRIAQQNAY